MHSGSTVTIFVAIIFASARTFSQALDAAQIESKSIQPIQVKYKLFPRPSNPTSTKILNIDNMFGRDGYVFATNLHTTFNGTVTATYVFINIDNSKLPYRYRDFIAPNTSAALLKQVNEQGAGGFRIKSYFYDITVVDYFYVQDTSRPSAKYTYRHEPCVSNLDELFTQINRNAADGYRLLNSFPLGNLCLLYIKDRSKQSKFVYKMVPNINNPADFLTKADQLGADGYRFVGGINIDLVSNGTSSVAVVPLYYRDTTQKGCTFSYSSAPSPDSPANILPVLQKQEARGFIFLTPFSVFEDSFLIFVKFHNCHHIKSMNIDSIY